MKKMEKVIVCILFCLSILATVTKVLTGFDIDEAYALAIPYRVLQGDRLFADMWEVHQTSFLLPYLFMKPFYYFVADGSAVVLYVRIVTSLLHGIVSLSVYLVLKGLLGRKSTAKDSTAKDGSFLAALCALGFYNFLPKWMISLDFSMQQLWFFTLYALCLLWVLRDKKDGTKQGSRYFWGLFLAGILLSLDVLAYPGMAVLYPISLLLLVWGKGMGKEKAIKVLGLTAGCAASAAVFLICIFRYMTPGALIEAVSKVFMDGSHQYDPGTKLALYASQWLEVLVQSVILLVPALVLALVFLVVYNKSASDRKMDRHSFGLAFCIIFELAVSGLIVLAGVFVTWGSFRLQVRYIIQFIMAFILFFMWRREKENKEEGRPYLWGLILSAAAFIGVLAASNVGPTSSASYLVAGNLLFMLFTLLLAKERERLMQILGTWGAVMFLLSLIMCKGFYMRNTEYVPGDITDPLQKIKEGPLAGIYVREADYGRYMADYAVIQANTTQKDRVLFMGTESLCNLYANGRLVIPTTISTPAFNEQWVEYFTLYPDKYPTIIFLAKNTVDDRDKFFAKNPFGIWIAERYDVEYMGETSSLCIIRPKEEEKGE